MRSCWNLGIITWNFNAIYCDGNCDFYGDGKNWSPVITKSDKPLWLDCIAMFHQTKRKMSQPITYFDLLTCLHEFSYSVRAERSLAEQEEGTKGPQYQLDNTHRLLAVDAARIPSAISQKSYHPRGLDPRYQKNLTLAFPGPAGRVLSGPLKTTQNV